jgi:hypothetical protein
MTIVYGHFQIEERVVFRIGETMRPRYDLDTLVGFDKLTRDGKLEPIKGRVLPGPLMDERARMPLTIDGIQLWRGF